MKHSILAVALVACTFLSGCATYQAGGVSTAEQLKRFDPVPGKASVYVCRIPAMLAARGVKTVVYVDNEAIGTLRQNSFVHTTVEPGKHGVLLRHDGLGSGSGGFESFEVEAGEVRFFWVGVTGKGWGVLTVDNFDTVADARKCVAGAEYSVPTAE
jgi:hypothetical protein